MARRTVKAHFNRLFLRFGITGGIKRVKLATFVDRRQTCTQVTGYGSRVPSEREHRVIQLVAQGLKNSEVASEIGTRSTWLKIIYASFTTNWALESRRAGPVV